MTKAIVILDPNWRTIEELFAPKDLARLHDNFEIIWGKDDKIPIDIYNQALPNAMAVIAANPVFNKDELATAKNLQVIIEVSGTFPNTIDYDECEQRNIQVLSCSPGFHRPVAEMGLAMLLAGARGLITEHEAFRKMEESWLDDKTHTDFTMYGENVGFIGFGRIAQELTRLLQAFNPKITAYDPWLDKSVAKSLNVELTSLESVCKSSRAFIICAIPSAENHHLINQELLNIIPDNTFIILLSRAHLVDFDALINELTKGRFLFATDVFPEEPIAKDSILRELPNVILSPHRAAAVAKGRQLIGEMIVDDLCAIVAGKQERRLLVANAKQVKLTAGIGDLKNTTKL